MKLSLIGSLTVLVLAAGSSRALAAETLTSKDRPVSVVYDAESDAELAKAALAAGEKAYARLFTELGWSAPWSGGKGAPFERGVRIRIASTGLGAGTAVAERGSDIADTPVCDCSGSVVVDRGTSPTSDELEATVFHEMVHVSQYATDCTEAPSAYEGFAVAAEVKEYPDATFVRNVISAFQAFPEYPLDYWTMHMPCDRKEPCFPYQLGAALFPLYLVDRFEGGDPRALAKLFGSFGQPGTAIMRPPSPTCSSEYAPSWLDGVRHFLEAHGTTFEAAFDEFTRWRAITGPQDDGAHYSKGALLPVPAVAATHALDAGAAFEGELDVREYGTRYIGLSGADVTRERAWTFRITGDAAARWTASVIVWRAGQPTTDAPIRFTGAEGEGVAMLPEGTTRAMLVVAQLDDGSHSADAMDYDNARRFTYSARPVTAPAASPAAAPDAAEGDLDAGGCALAPLAPRAPLAPLASRGAPPPRRATPLAWALALGVLAVALARRATTPR